MLKSIEILELLKDIPLGYLSPDDELFTASKIHLLKSYKKLGAIGNYELDDIKKESTNFNTISPNKEIFCNFLGCDVIFDNVCSYQSHYNTIHRYKCSECKKSMPTEHLLDLHILEQHDSFFKARVERGERLHKCYLEGCAKLFFNPQERKEHCIIEHKFPSNFRFDKTGYKNKESLSEREQTNLDMLEKSKKECKFISFGHQKEKTFDTRICSKHKAGNTKALEEMDLLKEALDTI